MFKKKPPTKIEFTLKKIKDGGYMLRYCNITFMDVLFMRYKYQAFTTYQEAMNAVTIITEPLT